MRSVKCTVYKLPNGSEITKQSGVFKERIIHGKNDFIERSKNLLKQI